MSESKKEIVDKNSEIVNIDNEIISKAEVVETKIEGEQESKFRLKKEEINDETTPNAIVTGGIKQIGLERIAPVQIPQFLLMHPAVPRGIEIKANRLIQIPHDIIPFDDSTEAKEMAERCTKVLDNSDKKREIYLKKIIQGAYRFGTADSLLVINQTEDKVLKMEYQHPIYFGPAKYSMNSDEISKRGRIKINPKTKLPEAFTQYKQVNVGFGEQGSFDPEMIFNVGSGNNKKTIVLTPFGKEFEDDRVVSLMFDTLGDEPRGIPLIQFLHKTVKNLLRIEDAGAESMVKFGFPQWVGTSKFKTSKKLTAYAATLQAIKNGSVAVLPEGCDLTNIVPGTTEFNKVHDIFLTLVAIRLGIPKYQLLMDGNSSNRSTAEKQSEDLNLDIFADQIIVEGTVNEMFEKICIFEKGEDFTKFPTFVFGKMPTDVRAAIETEMRKAVIVKNYMVTANEMMKLGKTEFISPILDYAMKIIYPDGYELGKKDVAAKKAIEKSSDDKGDLEE